MKRIKPKKLKRIKERKSMSKNRKLLESHVLAYHKYLKDVIKKMKPSVLLAYCHPNDRSDFARMFNLIIW